MTQRNAQRRLRNLLALVVAIALAVLVVGFFSVRSGRLEGNIFLAVATVSGTIASVIGLLSLARPSLTVSDIANLEVEALGKMSALTKELEEAALAKASTRTEIEALELQRTQMEASVRRAAQVLFLRERVRRNEQRLGEQLGGNREIKDLVTVLTSDYEMLASLREEITRDPNAMLIGEVIQTLRNRQIRQDPFLFFLAPYARLASRLLGTVKQ
jgi:DNA-binding transcriptional regulator GbsR (MarR family)